MPGRSGSLIAMNESASRPALLPRRVVVGLDASEESLAALDWALALVTALGARLIVVHGVGLLEEGGYRRRPDIDGLVVGARRRAGDPTDVDIDVVVEDGPAADVIVRITEREEAGLIVVGSRGMGQAPRLLGSVSEAVLSHAHVPVLIIPRP
jgi:nucleotide-binding universal stress UspA family protein